MIGQFCCEKGEPFRKDLSAMNKTITLLIIGVIFLALLLMVFNSFRAEDGQIFPAFLTEKMRPQEAAPSARLSEDRPTPAPDAPGSAALVPPASKAAPRQAESAAAERPSSAAGAAVKTVPAQIDAGQAAPAGSPPQAATPARPAPPKVAVVPAPSAKQTGKGVKNIPNAVVYVTQEGVTLRLGGDAPLDCKAMLLRNPDRLALDFEGQWNVSIPTVPQNKLIKAVRVGRQADATRMVIDLHRAPASYRVVKTSPQGLDVRLR